MAEIKWIKLMTDMFDNSKIKYIRTLPEGNNIVLIWVMLLAKAGKCNSNGYIFLTENIPYTPDMLAHEFGFEINTIHLALGTLSKLNMIQRSDETIEVMNWGEYQNLEGMDKIREQNRLRKQKQRAKEKLLVEENSHVMSRDSHATEEERRKKKEDKEIDIYNNTTKVVSSTFVQQVIEKWNSLNLNKLVSINQGSKRYTMLNARKKEYGEENILKAIDNINHSSFLRGQNNRNWVITFDWFIKPNNFSKVLEENYTDKGGPQSGEPTGNITKQLEENGIGFTVE